MKADVYNIKGEKSGIVELSARLFGARWSATLVQQVYQGERANARHPWAHTKDRSEARGGGRKPWRQKGLGRARHGSIRSPIWIGGGVAHGPRNARDFSVKINKKMKAASVRVVLSKKMKDEELLVLDQFLVSEAKTKRAAEIFKKLQSTAAMPMKGFGKSSLLLAVQKNDLTTRSVRNIPNVHYIEPRNINTTALLHHRHLIVDTFALKELEQVFS